VTEIVEIPNRGHALVIDSGWREVADKALNFIQPSRTESSLEFLGNTLPAAACSAFDARDEVPGSKASSRLLHTLRGGRSTSRRSAGPRDETVAGWRRS